MPTASRRAVIIVRVSDPRQEREGLSMDNQEMVLKQYAAAQGFIVEKQFRFQESADHKLRKNFQQMVAFVKKRSDVPIIIGYRVDRLTRNYHDHVLLDDLRLNHGKELHFVHDRLVISQRTVGREITEWDTKVYLAKSYLNRLKEDAYMTLSFKLARGEWPGKAPFGYRNARVDNRSVLELQEPQCLAVQSAFKLYSSGAFSMEQVRREVNRMYGLRISKGNIDHILRNTFYFGQMNMHGKGYPHVHPVLISRASYDRVCEIRASHGKTPYKYRGLSFLYRGLITCGDCGCRVTPERKRRQGRVYHYYHCTQFRGKHNAAWLKEEQIETQVRSVLNRLRIPGELVDGLIERAEGQSHREEQRLQSRRRTASAEIEKLKNRLERLYEDRLDGLICVDEYCERAEIYRKQIATLGATLSPCDLSGRSRGDAVKRFLETCQQAGETYVTAEISVKRQILKTTFQNMSIQGERLLLEPISPFKEVLQCADSENWLRLEDMFRHTSGGSRLDLIESWINNVESINDEEQS